MAGVQPTKCRLVKSPLDLFQRTSARERYEGINAGSANLIEHCVHRICDRVARVPGKVFANRSTINFASRPFRSTCKPFSTRKDIIRDRHSCLSYFEYNLRHKCWQFQVHCFSLNNEFVKYRFHSVRCHRDSLA